MQLKEYQQQAVDAVRFFHEAAKSSKKVAHAFVDVLEQTNAPSQVYQPFVGDSRVPYSCVRLPTGGGKTLLAAHCVSVMAESYCETDSPLTLWLVPSTKILEQTIRALKNRNHPYHRALRQSLTEVNVASVSEALSQDVGLDPSRPLVIVATMQSFRVAEKEGRKVYDENGFLSAFFDKAAAQAQSDLMRDESGTVVTSLANLIAMRRPIVIVDEAHNSTTQLSYEVLRDLQPSSILEMTATPNSQSNVIYAASAAQLKAEEMIKIPIFLETSRDWKQLLSDSIGLLSQLEEAAIRERVSNQDYIRPMILFQAEKKHKDKETKDYEFIEKTLKEDFDVSDSEIAVSVGARDDLAGVDLDSRDCPVKFIVTQSKLKEGWDCPFAYVLVSLAEQQSATAVEQILGRVLRMPGATRRHENALNKSYAFIHSKNFHEAAQKLQDNLVKSGFNKYEAARLVQPLGGTITLKGKDDVSRPTKPITTSKGTRGVKVEVDGKEHILGDFDEDEQEELQGEFPDAVIRTPAPEEELVLEELPDPRIMRVPRLGWLRDSKISDFTVGAFSTAVWNPADYTSVLKKESFSIKFDQVAQAGEIDVGESGVHAKRIKTVQEQMLLVTEAEAWNTGRLAAWLTRKIGHKDVTPPVFRAWIAQLLERLLDGETDIQYLVQHKYRLRDAVERLYKKNRETHLAAGWQAALTSETLVVRDEHALEFHEHGEYAYSRPFIGSQAWDKHLFEVVGDLKSEGEEFECAVEIDSMDEVEFWVRNLERKHGAFSLQLPTGRFFPDFIAKLKDGRVAVIEYKGEVYVTNDDSKIKNTVGEAWAAASNGSCVFVMVSNKNWESLRAALQ